MNKLLNISAIHADWPLLTNGQFWSNLRSSNLRSVVSFWSVCLFVLPDSPWGTRQKRFLSLLSPSWPLVSFNKFYVCLETLWCSFFGQYNIYSWIFVCYGRDGARTHNLLVTPIVTVRCSSHCATRPLCLWSINKKTEEFVTLHSDFLEMPYELNIKIKCAVPLLLGDVKSILIPPRITNLFPKYHIGLSKHSRCCVKWDANNYNYKK